VAVLSLARSLSLLLALSAAMRSLFLAAAVRDCRGAARYVCVCVCVWLYARARMIGGVRVAILELLCVCNVCFRALCVCVCCMCVCVVYVCVRVESGSAQTGVCERVFEVRECGYGRSEDACE